MKAYTESENLQSALRIVNEKYNGNLDFKRFDIHRNHVVFTLKVNSTDDEVKGYRRGYSGRKIASACWHAYRDLMKVLFDLDSECRLVSAQTLYTDRSHFHHTFESTGDINIGSMDHPLSFRNACDCKKRG